MAVSIPQVVTEDRASGALVIDGSLKFDSSKSIYLNRTPSFAGNRRTWTWSGWVKKNKFTTSQALFSANGFGTGIYVNDVNNNGEIAVDFTTGTDNSTRTNRYTTALFRDPSAWYHIVVAVDTTQSTDSNKIKLYVNGTQQSLDNAAVGTWPALNGEGHINSAVAHSIGRRINTNDYYLDGYQADVHFIDGQALGPGYFGYTDPLTNTWRPKKFIATGPNNGSTWSNNWSASGNGFVGGAEPAQVFDGSSENYLNNAAGGQIVTWDTSSYTLGGNLKILCYSSSAAYDIYVNGTKAADTTTSISLIDCGTVSDINEIQFAGTTYDTSDGLGSAGIYVYEILIDGVPLLDGDTLNVGVNGFYLPMDGNSPIGQDQSGRGNNWTPVNFGGSNTIEKATGALPILNTLGGTVARPGVLGSEVSKNYTTTSNTAAGSGYEFDQTSGFNPSLSFVRGATYTFDYTDSSSHPLRFSSTDPDSSVTSYTDGTNTSVSNTVKITVPHNAPDTLYYYCTSHNSMNGSISVTTDTKKADPYAWKCILALPLAGDNIDVSDQINCTTSAKTLAVNGDAASSGEASNFYAESFKFDGSGDYLGATSNSDFAMGTGDFTLECWVYRTGGTAFSNFIATRGGPGTSAGYTFGAQGSANGYDVEFYTDGLKLDGGTQDITYNKWHHVAVTRTGTTLSSYVNGVLNTTTTNSQNFSNTSLAVGMTNDGSQGPMQGHLCDVRIYKGVSKYSGGSVGEQVFIPALTNPDILPDTPSGIATKTQLTKITDGAVSFDGTGDYLRVENTDMAMGTGDFTVEAFIYNNSHVSYRNYIGTRETGQGDPAGWCIASNAGGDLYVYSAGLYTNLTTKIGTKRWYHVAYVREGGTHKWYVDGILRGTDSASRDYTDDLLTIGSNSFAGSEPVDGFISNVRVIKGTAIYTSNFIPPSAPLTNVTNTKLLCCQSNSSAGRAAVSPNISGINDGKVWSDGVTIPTSSVNGVASNLFDGDLTTSVQTTNTTEWVEVNLGSVSFSTSFELYGSSSYNQNYEFDHAGGTYAFNGNFGGNNWLDFASNLTSPVTAFRFKDSGGTGSASILAVRVDNTILLDPIAPKGNAAPTNFNPFNTDINTVRGRECTYCTWNPLTTTTSMLFNGNLVSRYTSASWKSALGSTAVSSGKWYWENQLIDAAQGHMYGIALPTAAADSHNTDIFGVYAYDGTTFAAGAQGQSYTSAFSPGDIIGVALNLTPGGTSGTLTYYKNGISLGVAFSTLDCSKTYFPWVLENGNASTGGSICNFGQKPFKFPPPDGYQPLTSSTVRPDTVVPRPDQYVRTTLYTGDDNDGRTITLGHEADLVWVKGRNAAAGHLWQDTVRGPGQTVLATHSNALQTTETYGQISAFTKNGITVTSGSTSDENINYPSRTYVAWSWKAGGSKGTFNVDDVGYATAAAAGLSASGNSWDSDPTGASIGTKQGFSIIKHSGTGSTGSLPHGLTQKPDLLITKAYNGTTGNWNVYTDLFDGSNDYMYFNNNDHKGNSSLSAFTSELFYYGYTTDDYIHYLWHSVPGLQKFGVYTGNSSTNFVSLDFRPALIWVKRAVANSSADTTTNNSAWTIMDSTRLSYNGLTPNHLYANHTIQEGYRGNASSTSTLADMTLEPMSNGFYLNGPATETNSNTGTFLYCAWAEAPTFNLYGAQSNAR